MNSLHTERLLKDDIISDLTTEEKSISGLQKSLEEKGRSLHRLVLTGYLKAMVDSGFLREKEIKPSRIYSINQNGSRDIYDLVGLAVTRTGSEDSGSDALLVLNYLFNRPIFARRMYGNGTIFQSIVESNAPMMTGVCPSTSGSRI